MKGRENFLAPLVALMLVGSARADGEESIEQDDPIARGKALVVERCAECHTLRRVFTAHYDRAAWNDALERMTAEGLELTAAERDEVLAYLETQGEERSLAEAVGELHFLLLHFPIVLITLVAVLELVAWIRGKGVEPGPLHHIVRACVVFTIPTILLGLLLASETATMPSLLHWHRNLGLTTGVFIVLAWLLRERAIHTFARRPVHLYRAAILAAAGSVALTGHLGGSLVHGDPLQRLVSQLG